MLEGTFLFIGGPADGDRMAVRSGQHVVHVPLPCSPLARHTFSEIPLQDAPWKKASYRSEAFVANGRVFNIFIDVRLTVAEAMEMLIRNYNP